MQGRCGSSLVGPGHWQGLRVGSSPGDAELTPHQEQSAAEDAAFISIQAFPALLDLPQDLEVSKVSCGSRHTAVVTRECPALNGGAAGGTPAFGAAREQGGRLTGDRAHRDPAGQRPCAGGDRRPPTPSDGCCLVCRRRGALHLGLG